jgi:hypothetical protein
MKRPILIYPDSDDYSKLSDPRILEMVAKRGFSLN